MSIHSCESQVQLGNGQQSKKAVFKDLVLQVSKHSFLALLTVV